MQVTVRLSPADRARFERQQLPAAGAAPER